MSADGELLDVDSGARDHFFFLPSLYNASYSVTYFPGASGFPLKICDF